ncbi:hypothetical protein ACKAV7_014755 [Fusarium commune]
MHFNLVSLLAYMSLGAAMPAKRETIDEHALHNILGDLEARGETVESLVKRIDARVYRDEIPDCSKVDPSKMIPKQTGYSVDQGVKLPKDGKDDACTTGTGADHCWTEYWLVESAVESTSICNSNVAQIGQGCTSHTRTWSNGVDWKIVDASIDLAIPNSEAKITLGSSVNYQHTDLNEVQQQTKNAKGRYVLGQAEFSIAIPVNHIVGCNAKCSDLTYNEPIPTDGTVRVPFDVTFD